MEVVVVAVVVTRMKRGEDRRTRRGREGEKKEAREKEQGEGHGKITSKPVPTNQQLNSIVWLILLCYENRGLKTMNVS